MNKFYSAVKYLIGWPLSLIAFIFILRLISTQSSIFFQIKSINWLMLFLSVLLYIIYFFLRAYLWKYLLKNKVSNLSFKKISLFWSMSELKRYIPGSIWSFAARTTSFESSILTKKEIVQFLAKEAVILCLSTLILSYFYIEYFLKNELSTNLFLFFTFFCVLTFIFGDLIVKKIKINLIINKAISVLLPNHKPFENFKILILGVATFFTFGIGTFFALLSISYINIDNILILSSLFTFAFFVGYMSLITPMGLGVREGITTFGLSSFINYSFSALFSVYSRIIFIIAELLSLAIIIFWNKANQGLIVRFENFILKHKNKIILLIFMLIYIAYFSFASILRYDNFYTGRFDLGNMDQVIWNTSHGKIFQLTDPDGTQIISRLSVHADLILILISPLYLIWPHPQLLLILQTIILALGSLAIYLICKEVLKNKYISLIFSAIYLLNPAVGFTNLYDFHPVTLSTTFLLFAFYFFIKRMYFIFFIFAVLTGLTKEEEWAIVGVFGLFLAGKSYIENRVNIKWGKIIFGLLIFLIGIFLSYTLIAEIIPQVKGSDHFALTYYSDFGSSSTEILKNILLNPLKTIATLLGKTQIQYLAQLFGPLGFLSLLSPLLLIFAVPDLLIDLLSNNPQLHQIYYQYSASITPFIFISAIYGVRYLVSRINRINYQHISIYLLMATLFYCYITGPLPGTKQSNTDMFSKQLTNSNKISKILSSIPKNYSIAATNNLGSHLSRRERIYNIPLGLDRADIITILIDHGFSSQSIFQQKRMIEDLKNNKEYVLKFSDVDFYLFAKRNINLKM